jgi:hypothetical protein
MIWILVGFPHPNDRLTALLQFGSDPSGCLSSYQQMEEVMLTCFTLLRRSFNDRTIYAKKKKQKKKSPLALTLGSQNGQRTAMSL